MFFTRKKRNPLADLGPLYHSYRLFGVKNEHLPGIYEKNQKSKEYIINSYIMMAIAKCKKTIDTEVSFAELFCADGYYAMIARHFGTTHAIGIDNNRDSHSNKMPVITKRLNIDNCIFVPEDVNNISNIDKVDIVANVGGLYHVANPDEILDKSYEMARKFLIVQTVVSLANDDPDYFETPAPGWTWGCRYSRASFEKLVQSKGWNIVDSHFNLLEGNEREEDRGSVYYLISK